MKGEKQRMPAGRVTRQPNRASHMHAATGVDIMCVRAIYTVRLILIIPGGAVALICGRGVQLATTDVPPLACL